MRKNIYYFTFLLCIFVSGCGGGESSQINGDAGVTPQNPPSAGQDKNYKISGTATLDKELVAFTLSPPQSPIENLIRKSRSHASYAVSAVTSAILPTAHAGTIASNSKMSLREILCYEKFNIKNMVTNLDIDSNGVIDSNISGDDNLPIKNIISDSAGKSKEQLKEDGRFGDIFLLDLHQGLELDKSSSNGVILNQSSLEGIAALNLDINGDDIADINVIDLSKEQPSNIEILNFDSDYDGFADINIDTDNDSMADTNIDEDKDCNADYSLIEVSGKIPVALAEVVLLDSQTLLPVANTETNEEGKYIFGNIKPGQYFIKIIANVGGRNYGNIEFVNLTDDTEVPDLPLTVNPKLIKSEEPTHYDFGTDEEQTLSFKQFFFEPSRKNLYLNSLLSQLPVDVNNPDTLFIALQPTGDSSIQVIEYDLKITQGLCVLSLNDLHFASIVAPTCQRRQTHLGLPNKNSDIYRIRFHYIVTNEDGRHGFLYTGETDDILSGRETEHDIFFRVSATNSGWIEPDGVNLDKVDYLVINDSTFQSIQYGTGLPTYESGLPVAPLDITIFLKEKLKADDAIVKYTVQDPRSCPEYKNVNELEILSGQSVKLTIPLECFPSDYYDYNVYMILCQKKPSSIDDGECLVATSDEFGFTYRPERFEKPPFLNDVFVNGNNLYSPSAIIRPNDNAAFSVDVGDPNNLPTEWRICFVTEEGCSEWTSTDKEIRSLFTENNINAKSLFSVQIRNNDGVAKSRQNNTEEIDVSVRRSVKVSQI